MHWSSMVFAPLGLSIALLLLLQGTVVNAAAAPAALPDAEQVGAVLEQLDQLTSRPVTTLRMLYNVESLPEVMRKEFVVRRDIRKSLARAETWLRQNEISSDDASLSDESREAYANAIALADRLRAWDKTTVDWLWSLAVHSGENGMIAFVLFEEFMDNRDFYELGARAYHNQMWGMTEDWMRRSLRMLAAKVSDAKRARSLDDRDPNGRHKGRNFAYYDLESADGGSDIYAREPYNYLQFSLYNMQRLAAAAVAAESYLELNPSNQVMQDNLEWYLNKISDQELLDAREAVKKFDPVQELQGPFDVPISDFQVRKTLAGGDNLARAYKDQKEENKNIYLSLLQCDEQRRELLETIEDVALGDTSLQGPLAKGDSVRHQRHRLSGRPGDPQLGLPSDPMDNLLVQEAKSDDSASKANTGDSATGSIRPTTAHDEVKHWVPRRYNLTYEEFFREYVIPGKPVIIADGVAKMVDKPWTLDYIEEICGNVTITAREYNPNATTWGRLVDGKTFKIKDFIRDFKINATIAKELEEKGTYPNFDPRNPRDPFGNPFMYLFDFPLPETCPEILQNFSVPRYFSGDLLQRIPRNTSVPYRDSWPSLFIGPKFSRSALHVDSFGSQFFMALFQGVKHWKFFRHQDRNLLYENRAQGIFGIDSFHLNMTQSPLVSKTVISECFMKAGEILYVPAGAPHQVENTEVSIGVSMNYIDAANIGLSMDATYLSGMAGYRGQWNLYKALAEGTFEKGMSRNQRDLNFWKEFKVWPRPPEEGPWDLFPPKEYLEKKTLRIA